MAYLSMTLLGTFEVVLKGNQVPALEYDKVRALLAYLMVEADRPHRREMLASLLWPEHNQRKANRSLSQALYKLRQGIDDANATPPLLIITPQTLQFNATSDYFLDVTTFTSLLATCAEHEHHTLEMCQARLGQLQQAIALYRGNFLAGFSISNSLMFSEWATFTRERLHRSVNKAFHHLVECLQTQGQYEAALQYAWQWVELEPWHEEAQQQLITLLALNGQRTAALSQYETCCRLLNDEVGVAPAAETVRLYEQIRDGRLRRREVLTPAHPATAAAQARPAANSSSATVPPGVASAPASASPQHPIVARDDELAQLHQHLDMALAGQGQLIFVTGEAGQGKTVLMQEFARQAQTAHPDLVVAQGSSSAPTGLGDPYLPLREILALLTGDVEARWLAGAMSQEQSHRLRQGLPEAVQVLLEAGPDLINTLLPGEMLLKRASTFCSTGATWLDQLAELVKGKLAASIARNVPQSALFEQYTRVLTTVASQTPLLLLLDDLQWVDAGSASLLFHLGRRLTGSRIMLVGAYRPAEVNQGRPASLPQLGGAERHPLEPVVNEFKRYFGKIEIDLNQAEGSRFIEAWLDTEPNRLDKCFRHTLYQQTQGQPLFTVELLRAMAERGDLTQDQHDHWVAGAALDWDTLPVRVEAVIAERMAVLPPPLRNALTIASVEGEIFTAELMARVQQLEAQALIRQLDDILMDTYGLIQAGGVRWVEGQCLSLYRFRHSLFQKYLYNSLSPSARVHLHQAVGTTLEALYGQHTDAVALQLGWHFEQAGMTEKAVVYGQQAAAPTPANSTKLAATGCDQPGLALFRNGT